MQKQRMEVKEKAQNKTKITNSWLRMISPPNATCSPNFLQTYKPSQLIRNYSE